MAPREKAPTPIIESVRASWPGSYMFKIQSFSALSEFARLSVSYCKCFESPEFESNGHKWKLSIYPNGDEKVGVKNHISLYLVAADDDDIDDSVEFGISATFKMFVFDHLRDNFLTIQVSACFDEFSPSWGWAKFILLSELKKKSRGFILKDSLIAEVEIEKAPIVAFFYRVGKSYISRQLHVKIQSFSLLSEFLQKSDDVECFRSPEFECSGHKWKLSVYPNGKKNLGVEDHISLYLVAEDADIDSLESGIRVMFKMSVYDHCRDNFLTIQVTCNFGETSSESFAWGFDKFILLSMLKDKSHGFILDDSLVVEVEVNIISKDSPLVTKSG
ncbi:hypothetical protein QQ045_011762 [Rhodiola kirilowii]